MKIIFSSLFLLAFNYSLATTVAVVDTGVDYTNDFISSKILLNDLECPYNGLDDDNNGAIDDCYGWNFVEGNNSVFNFVQPSSFSTDIQNLFKYSYMLTYQSQGIDIMDSDIESWYFDLVNTGNLTNVLENAISWSTYSQGTHVAGVVARQSANTKILPIKYLSDSPTNYRVVADIPLLTAQLTAIAANSINSLYETFLYAKSRGAKVIHTSFMEGYDFVKTNQISQLSVILTEADAVTFTDFYQTERVDGLKVLIEAESDLLFVFPAGDSAEDITTEKSFPASVGASNSITVGASLDRTQLWDDSSYSATLVDIVAPGVGILSTVPSDNWLNFTGSNVAASYISGICAAMIDENPSLTPVEVKSLLMQTVDVKAFLAGVVVSSGVVNKKRALEAAYYSNAMPVADAVSLASTYISDIDSSTVYSR